MAQLPKSTNCRTITNFVIFLQRRDQGISAVTKKFLGTNSNNFRSTKVCSRDKNGNSPDHETKNYTGDLSTRIPYSGYNRIIEWPRGSYSSDMNFVSTYILSKTPKKSIIKETSPNDIDKFSRKTFLLNSKNNTLYNMRRYSNCVPWLRKDDPQLRKIHIYCCNFCAENDSKKPDLQPKYPMYDKSNRLSPPDAPKFDPVRERGFEKKPKSVTKSDKCRKISSPCPRNTAKENDDCSPPSQKKKKIELCSESTSPPPPEKKEQDCTEKMVPPISGDCVCICECKMKDECLPCELKRLPKVVMESTRKCVPKEQIKPCPKKQECVPSKTLPKLSGYNDELPRRCVCECPCKPKPICNNTNSSSNISSFCCPDSLSIKPQPNPKSASNLHSSCGSESPTSSPTKGQLKSKYKIAKSTANLYTCCSPEFQATSPPPLPSVKDKTACTSVFSPSPPPPPTKDEIQCPSVFSPESPPPSDAKLSDCPVLFSPPPPPPTTFSSQPDCPPPIQQKKSCPKIPLPRCRKTSLWERITKFFRARPNCPTPEEWKRKKQMAKIEKLAKKANLGVYDLCGDPVCICKEVQRRCCLARKQSSMKRHFHTLSTVWTTQYYSKMLRSSLLLPTNTTLMRKESNQNHSMNNKIAYLKENSNLSDEDISKENISGNLLPTDDITRLPCSRKDDEKN